MHSPATSRITILSICSFSKATLWNTYINTTMLMAKTSLLKLKWWNFNFRREVFAKNVQINNNLTISTIAKIYWKKFIERNLLKGMMESEIWLNCCFFRVYQHFFISVGKCPREWIIASLQICIWLNQDRIVLLTAYWNTRRRRKRIPSGRK